MIDELDLLKKDWKKREHSFQQYNETDIYKMIHKKSSSIVKWILIISILELVFWISSSLCMKNSSFLNEFKSYDKYHFLTISEIISYAIIVIFIYLFYRNHNKISTSNSVKELIKSILRARKTVQNYVKIVITYTFISSLVVFWIQFNFDEKMIEINQNMVNEGNEFLFYGILLIMIIIFLGIVIGLIWLFYRIIYGILLKRLYKNYEELKKIDY